MTKTGRQNIGQSRLFPFISNEKLTLTYTSLSIRGGQSERKKLFSSYQPLTISPI